MITNRITNLSLKAVMLFGCGGALCLEASTRETTLLTDARVSGKFDQRLSDQIRGDRDSGSEEGLEISLLGSILYDDNIFRTAKNEEEDLVTSIVPRVSYTAGQKEGRAWVRASYLGDIVLYLENSDDSRVDHRVELEGVIRKRLLKFAYAGSWAKLGDPDPDTGGSPDRMEWSNRVVIGVEPKGKTSGEFFLERNVLDQDAEFLNDVEETAAGINVFYRYSPKTQLGGSYSYGEVKIDGAPSQEVHRLVGSVFWQPRRQLSVSLEGGAEYRDFGTGVTDWEPVMAGRIAWAPRSGTEVYLTGYRRQEASSFFDGQNFTVAGGVLGLSQRIHRNWSGRLEVGWEQSDYFATEQGVDADRKDDSFFVRPTISYLSPAGHVLQIFYQWSDSDSSDSEFGYSNQEVGISLETNF